MAASGSDFFSNFVQILQDALLTGVQGGNPVFGAIAGQVKKKAKPKGGGTTTTKGKPGFLEELTTALAQPGSSGRTAAPPIVPIVDAPPPPRGDPNTQRLLEQIILELGGLNQRR